MRAREILDEDYHQSLESSLNDYLVGAKGAGMQQIDTSKLVAQLQGMGFSVDENSIIPLLSNNPSVANATPSIIQLIGNEGVASSGDSSEQDSAARVRDMAQKATDIG